MSMELIPGVCPKTGKTGSVLERCVRGWEFFPKEMTKPRRLRWIQKHETAVRCRLCALLE